jgi:hypothetical protein
MFLCIFPPARHALRKIPTCFASLPQTVRDTYAIVFLVNGWEAHLHR